MSEKSYDVFMSYNSEDREAVERLAVCLADRAGLRPWFDKWELIPGEPWVRNLERGLEASSSCAVFVGKAGEGPWQRPEVETALRQQVQNPNFRVIPVLLPQAPKEPELPPFLSGHTWVDFREGLDDDNSLWRLECGILGIPPGRGRPRQPAEEGSPSTPVPVYQGIGLVDLDISLAERPVNVFISYRHQEPDRSLAQALAEALDKAGHQVFIDTGIRWGANWVQEIQKALEKSEYLLLLLSPEAAQSEMVGGEVIIARELARRQNGVPVILPVRVLYPFTQSLPYQLAINLHNIHQESWSEPADTSRLVSCLLATIEDRTGWHAEAPVEVPPRGARSIAPQPHFDPRDLITPGGALDVDSRFYIKRESDEEVFGGVLRPRAMVTVRGPRQTGKTSLIMRVYADVRRIEGQLRAAFLDFQALSSEDLQSLSALWRAIAVAVEEQLELEKWDSETWRLDIGHDRNFSRFLDQFVFDENDVPLLICLDEVDRVFNTPIRSEFFASVRAFYNRGALDPVWKKVRWLLGTSSEPSFFIEDLTQSPFNIGLRVELSNFATEEVAAFSHRHGLTMDLNDLSEIVDYVGGRPYLVHLLLYHLARDPRTRDRLFDPLTAGGGVFRDHLHRYLLQFQQEPALAGAMKKVVDGRGCEDVRMAERLEAAGLIRRDEDQRVVPLCRLYAAFFGNELR